MARQKRFTRQEGLTRQEKLTVKLFAKSVLSFVITYAIFMTVGLFFKWLLGWWIWSVEDTVIYVPMGSLGVAYWRLAKLRAQTGE